MVTNWSEWNMEAEEITFSSMGMLFPCLSSNLAISHSYSLFNLKSWIISAKLCDPSESE